MFKIILNVIKKHETVTDNPLIRIYVNEIEKKVYIQNKNRVLP